MSKYFFNANTKGYLKWLFGHCLVWTHILIGLATSSVFSLQLRLLFRCRISFISSFSHSGKPSFLSDSIHVLKHISDFISLHCVTTAMFFSMVSEKAAWRIVTVEMSQPIRENQYHHQPCVLMYSVNYGMSWLCGCLSWCPQILKDIQHICDFHPPLGKANSLKVEHQG